MKFTFVVPVLAVLAMSAPALADQSVPPPDRSAEFAKFHAEMCTNHYAKTVGKLAEVEVRLGLSADQKSAWERFKDIKLKHAKAAAAKCADFKPLDREASILDLRQRQITRLEERLATLKAETPALEALVKVLTPDQQKILARAAHDGRGEGFGHRPFREDFGGFAPHRFGPQGHGPQGQGPQGFGPEK